MRILITGSTGFIGRNLIPVLLNEKHQILELTRNKEKSQILFGDSTKKHEISDDQESLRLAVKNFNPEVVIHLASMLTASDDYESMQKLLNSNIIFFCRILDTLKETELKLFINTGTFAEYYKGDGVLDPAYLYAATKTASRSFLDYYSKIYNFKQTTVVPYTIYGGNDTQKKIIDIIYESLDSPIPTDLSPGEQILDFIHIDDIANFYVSLVNNMEKLEKKTNFQLGTGNGTSLKKLTAIIESKTGKKANINWGGKSYRTTDVMYAVADITKLKKIINWVPKISIKIGIQKYTNINRIILW